MTADEAGVVERVRTDLFVGGQWQPAEQGRTLPVEDPSTGKVLTAVADASPADGVAALTAADEAQHDWAATAPRQRAELLRRTYEAIVASAEDLALLMTLEMGKPLTDSRAEVTYAAEFFRWFAEEAVRIDGRFTVAPNGGARLLVMHQPVGPSMLVTPWNFPLAMGARKVAAALAAGCTFVLKPAAQTPLSSLALAAVLEEAGLPAGVGSVLPTSEAGALVEPLLSDPRSRKLSFTGSTAIGSHLLACSAESVLRVSLELGGNAPFLVFADADVDAAVDGAVLAKMRNMGEACTAANRFLVHEAVADQFTEALAARLSAMPVGRGTDEGVQVGPLIDAPARRKVVELVDNAVERGATLVCGGRVVDGPGWFFQPTVLADVPDDAALLGTEIFGPVAPIRTFTDDEAALAEANATPYGLVAYAYTADLAKAHRVAEALDVGMVGLNQGIVSNPAAPFGGRKRSGLGREGGAEGIHEYLDVKYVALPAG